MTSAATATKTSSANSSSSQVDIELSELRDEVSRWKRRYYAERDRNQQLQDDVDRMEIKLKAAVRDGLARGRSTLVAMNAAAASSAAASSSTAAATSAAAAGDTSASSPSPTAGEGAATSAASAIAAIPSSASPHVSPPPGGRRRKSNAADDARWQTKLNELASYKEEHGHCRVPVKHPTLGRWVNAQRTQFNYLAKGQRSSMTLERMQRLDELGFEWKWKSDKSKKKRKKGDEEEEEESGDDDEGDAREGSDGDGEDGSPKKKKKTKKKRNVSTALSTKWSQLWETRYAELTDFHATHGHCRVPYGDGKGLGKWVNRHRTDYAHFLNGSKSRLDVEKIDRLNALGFEWTVKRGRLNRDKLKTTTASGKSGEEEEGGGESGAKKKKKRPTRKAAKS